MEYKALRVILKRLVRGRGGVALIIGVGIIILFLTLSIFAPLIAPYDPLVPVGPPLSPPTWEFVMGTDNLGRDVFSRVVWGTRTALAIAFLATFLASSIGITLGFISGYRGGFLDSIMTFIMDSLYSFPSLILAIAIALALGRGVGNTSLSIALVFVPTYFRVIRNRLSMLKREPYVETAKALGADDWTILTKYILRGLFPFILATLFTNMADVVLIEASLSFLGLGVSPPTPDWGLDLFNACSFIVQKVWWMALYPGLMIALLALGFILLSEGLSKRFNPKLRER